MQWSVRGLELVEEWLDQHADEPDRCRAMAMWVTSAITGPRELSNGRIKRQGRGHPLHYAVVPGTGAMVVYFVTDAPVRVMRITSVIPAPDS